MENREFNLNMSLWDYAQKIADDRVAQKKGNSNYNPMNKQSHFMGILGEIIYGFNSGQLFDTILRKKGDGGADFGGNVQVKSSKPYKDADLIEYTNKDLSKFDYYVCVEVDMEKRTGHIIGWISVKEFKMKAKLKDFGYGRRYCMPHSELHKIKMT